MKLNKKNCLVRSVPFGFVLFLVLMSVVEVCAQDFTLSQADIPLRAGKTTTVKITPVTPSDALVAANITIKAVPDNRLTITPLIQENPQSVVFTLTAGQQTGDVRVNVTVGAPENTKPVTVSIKPVIDNASELSSTLQNLPSSLELKRNEPKVFLVSPGVSVQSGDLKVRSTREDIVVTSFDGQQLTIRAIGTGTAQVTIANTDNVILQTIDVTVKEAPQNVRPSPLEITIDKDSPEVDWFSPVKLLGLDSKDVTEDLKNNITPVADNSQILQVNNKKLKGLRKGDARLNLVATDGTVIGPVIIHVTVKPKEITFSSDTGSFILRPNQTIRVTGRLMNGQDVVDDARVTRWDYADEASKSRIVFADFPGTNTVSVTALPNADSGPAKLKAFFGDDLEGEKDFNVQTLNVTDFKPLQIRFDVLDEQTARDLFGKKAADDFHITKIRLFNKLRDSTNSGNSILVYGESLEVNVALEKKGDDGQWTTIATTEYKRIFGTDNPFPPDLTQDPNSVKPPATCVGRVSQTNFIARYRPLTFEMVANTHDRRDERSTRSRILLGMNSASSLASFITAIAVPAGGSDLPLGLDKFRNLLIPSFEKLFPNMREVQRQNIVSMAMRQLEEVPFGSDITRIVFFPKKPIKGVIPRTVVRIGAVSISDGCAEVAIIKKAGQP